MQLGHAMQTLGRVTFGSKGLRFETHRICAHMVPSRFRLGPGFGLIIGPASVPRLEVKCCVRNHIHVSSEGHHTFPEIRELLRQMGSGLPDSK